MKLPCYRIGDYPPVLAKRNAIVCVRSCRSPLFPVRNAYRSHLEKNAAQATAISWRLTLEGRAVELLRAASLRVRKKARKERCSAYKVGGHAALAEDDLRPLPRLELPAPPTLHHNVVGVDCKHIRHRHEQHSPL